MSFTSLVGQISYLKSCRFAQNVNVKYLFLKKWKSSSNKVIVRQISHESKSKTDEMCMPFMDMINARRAEAKKSIVVQVQSAQSFKELYTYCSSLGTINQMLHYTSGADQLVYLLATNPAKTPIIFSTFQHFIIVEFTKESYVDKVLTDSSHVDNLEAVPVHSNFLWFRATRKGSKVKQVKNFKLNVENGNTTAKDNDVKEVLQACENVPDQIVALHNTTALNDVATRLRFLTARQVELALSGMFPNAVAYPFGSSVNGFGKMGCDLDVVLRLTAEQRISEDNRLVFHCKAVNGYERSISQRHMEIVGDLLQFFLPGCTQIRRILQARVPIIKYYQQLTDVECDLSMSNMSGVSMSDLLYLFGSLDPRVRPLVFTIRKWAQEVGLTNSSPGRWITNFSLTLLVLAFLQNPGTSPILPSFNTLIRNAGSNDKYITEDGVNCTFLRDISKLNHKTKNNDSLESLLQQFFEFYSSFDFSSKAVSLNEAVPITKPEHSALYIVNPLERGLNVSKNVSLEELEKFKFELRNAAWIIESQEKKLSNWGILEIFESKRKKFPSNYIIPSRQGRLMEVSRLFEEQKDEECTDMTYKNENVEKEVEQIKRDTERRIKDVENSSTSNVKRQKSRR